MTIKTEVKRLHQALLEMFGPEIKLAQAYELMAKSKGYKDWNTASVHLTSSEPLDISSSMMDLVDRLGHEATSVDIRAWQHLLVYVPLDLLSQRLESKTELSCGYMGGVGHTNSDKSFTVHLHYQSTELGELAFDRLTSILDKEIQKCESEKT